MKFDQALGGNLPEFTIALLRESDNSRVGSRFVAKYAGRVKFSAHGTVGDDYEYVHSY